MPIYQLPGGRGGVDRKNIVGRVTANEVCLFLFFALCIDSAKVQVGMFFPMMGHYTDDREKNKKGTP